jgi:hypothetical protein
MKIKKLSLLLALFMVAVFSGSAFAAFQMTASTSVKNMPQSTCDQAGSYTLTAPGGLQMHENDVINFTLTNGVKLCKSIDYYLVVIDSGSSVATDSNITNNTSFPVYTTDQQAGISGNDRLDVEGTDIAALRGHQAVPTSDLVFGFHVVGNSGQSIITATLRRASITHGVIGVENMAAAYTKDLVLKFYDPDADSSRLNISFFDEKNNVYRGYRLDNPPTDNSGTVITGALRCGFIKKVTSTSDANYGKYMSNTAAEDNVLCLDTLTGNPVFESGEYVLASPSSSPYEQTYALDFTGTYRVAKISGTTGFTVAAVGKGTCPEFSIGAAVDQSGNMQSKSYTFDSGDYVYQGNPWGWAAASDACPIIVSQKYYGRGLLLTKSAAFSAAEQYKIYLTLARKTSGASSYSTSQSSYWFQGATPENVYWTTSTNTANTTSSGTQPGNAGTGNWSADNVGTFSVTKYKSTVQEAVYSKIYTSTYYNVGTTYTNQNSIMIDLPQVYYNPDTLSVGEEVAVYVQIDKYPCGTIATGYVCLATSTDRLCAITGCRLNCSYGINVDNPSWWSGMALTNFTANAGTATMVFTDTLGGTATQTVDLTANQVKVMLFGSDWFAALPTGHTLSQSKAWRVTVTTNFIGDAQFLIGGKGTTDVYGYNPRNTCTDTSVNASYLGF